MGRFLVTDNRWAVLRWSRAGRAALAIAAALAMTVAFAVSACLDEPFSECESGLICPKGQRCADKGDYCVDIHSEEECGDGYQDPDEPCDCGPEELADVRPGPCEGSWNRDDGGYCTTTCQLHCGDGKLVGEELCDGDQFLSEISCVSLGYDVNHLSCDMESSCSLIKFDACSYIGWREQVARNQLARSQFRQIWVIDDTYAIAVGGDSGSARIVSYEEGAWSIQDVSAAAGELHDVWASDSDDVFAVGGSADAGQILHYDGAAWSEPLLVAAGELVAIWGAASDDVFAVGDQGIIVHYDGMEWSAMDSGTASRLQAVWGSGSKDVFAAGAGGVIVHYDGSAWSPMVSGTDVTLTALWGVDGDLAYAAGENGVLLRYDGTWSVTSSPTALSWTDLWGVAANRIFGLDESNTIYFYDGASWYTLDHVQGRVSGLGGTSVTSLFAVGDVAGNGMIWKNHGFSLVDTARPQSDLVIADLWASDAANVFAVGDGGMILHHDGNAAGTWSEMTSPTTARLTGVWGNSASDVFVVGDGGVILHYDGATWSEMTAPDTTVLHAVWSASADVAYAVGEKDGSGVILSYDGAQWTEEKTISAHHLDAVAGSGADNVVAVGAQGAVYRFNGIDWEELTSPTEAELTAVWVGASDEIVVATFVGEIWHSAGDDAWSLRETSTSVRVNDLAGSDASDLFAAGDGIWHYNGSTWEPVRSQTGTLTAVWVLSTSRALFAGVDETIRSLYRL
jgi:hypothetical protein